MSMPVLRDQISIYNYPEHLNPFYQDDNHKRLRFWKIKRDKVDPKKTNNNSKSSSSSLRRSGSTFSISSIKEWLPLKTFTLRKKSSSLGINKTSESPPPLRHGDMTAGSVYIEDSSKYTTYNPHFRRSTGADVNTTNYRSSLQNMSQYNSFLQPRTSRWRQTIQNGSITPSMRARYGSENTMQAGISMSSINTNPFDDDYDEESILSTSTTQLSSSHVRKKKKRRAPLPPTVHQAVHTTTSGKVKSEINDCESIQAEGISRLTKDFQNFVMETEKEKDQDDTELTKLRIDEDSSPPRPAPRIELREATPDSIPLPVREKFEVLRIEEDSVETRRKKEVIKQDKEKFAVTKKLEEIQNCEIKPQTSDDTKFSNNARDCQAEPLEEVNLKISESEAENRTSDDENIVLSLTENARETEAEELEANEICEEKIINKIAVDISTAKPEPTEEFDELKTFPNHHQEHSITSTSSTTTTLVNDLEPEVVYRSAQLRIDNSESNIINMERVKVSSFIVDGPKHAYQDRTTFLETFSSSYRPREVTPIPKTRTERDPTPPIPPVRRRSVKDIIESINRNQQLLKTTNPPEDPRTKFMSLERSSFSIHDPQRFQEISSSEKKVELLLDDLRNYRKNSK